MSITIKGEYIEPLNNLERPIFIPLIPSGSEMNELG